MTLAGNSNKMMLDKAKNAAGRDGKNEAMIVVVPSYAVLKAQQGRIGTSGHRDPTRQLSFTGTFLILIAPSASLGSRVLLKYATTLSLPSAGWDRTAPKPNSYQETSIPSEQLGFGRVEPEAGLANALQHCAEVGLCCFEAGGMDQDVI
ncbi:hypothetical protein SKAU_G00132450 [Synaphobranchus kaupii]|uniref:Uncharacterized protein n=1 Tax=Synaphobranchus kaupii TaxID=118154 RepID=A0A9Q1J2G8_SYNKA|nr:hypothetical protein SKAU_G00132450 [Synaphobranchus kaupii]